MTEDTTAARADVSPYDDCVLIKFRQHSCVVSSVVDGRVDCLPYWRVLLSCHGRNAIEVTPWSRLENGRVTLQRDIQVETGMISRPDRAPGLIELSALEVKT